MGVVEYMSSTCMIAPFINPENLLDHIGILPEGNDALFINRLFIAKMLQDYIFASVKAFKKIGGVHIFVSICYSLDNEIHVQTTTGKYNVSSINYEKSNYGLAKIC